MHSRQWCRDLLMNRMEKYRYHDFRINVNYVCLLFSCNIFTSTIFDRIENCTTKFSFLFLFVFLFSGAHIWFYPLFTVCLLGK